jgi:OOP family OmpA-OmpF porin
MRSTQDPFKLRAIATCAGIAFGLTACGVLPDSSITYSNPGFVDQEPAFGGEPSPFAAALAEGYLELARDAHENDNHPWDASAYVRRSLRVQAGEDVTALDPDRVRAIRADGSEADAHDARAVHSDVVAAVAGHRDGRPQECARAQLLYDNWIEEERERTLQYTDPEEVFAQLQEAIAACTAPLVKDLPPYEPEPRHFFVMFAFDKAEISEPAMKVIAVAVAEAQASGGVVIVIGHTDRAGADDYNLRLSLGRAEAVAAVLVEGGVSPDQISIEAIGEAEPLVPTDDGERNSLNRRVVITVS